MTQNEATDLIPNVQSLLSHVDSVIVIDGGSQDLTIPYLRNWARSEPKLRFFISPWRDNFPEQRNQYLRRVGEIAADGDWVLVADPDEFFDLPTLESLRRLAAFVPTKREHFHGVSFQCRSVTMRGAERVHENVDHYWKPLFFKWSPSLRYTHAGEGAVHETLSGITPIYQTGHHPEFPALLYEHRKQADVIWPRGARNLFIGGGGPNLGSKNKSWVELRAITDRLGLKTWREFHAYLIAGEYDPALRDWMICHRHESGYDGASEVREVYKTAFRLYHPEEEPPECRSESIE